MVMPCPGGTQSSYSGTGATSPVGLIGDIYMIKESFLGSNKNRRRAKRYTIFCPVQFDKGTGILCNQSVTGVLFKTDKAFAIDEFVKLFIVLEDHAQRLSQIYCRGKVVRIETSYRQQKVAVDIGSFHFL
jgi:hypothetical protein